MINSFGTFIRLMPNHDISELIRTRKLHVLWPWAILIILVLSALYLLCNSIVGIFLDFLGAFILVTPYVPSGKRFMLSLPFPPGPKLKKLEEHREAARKGELEIKEGDIGFKEINELCKELTSNDFKEIKMTIDSQDNWHVHYEGCESGEIIGSRMNLMTFVHKTIERKLLSVGTILLFLGFGIQLASLSLPSIFSPIIAC